MRRAFSSGAAVALLALASPATAGDAPILRAPTRIPAESLGLALRTLAKERDFQLVYDSAQVDRQRTTGAAGILTIDEALNEVLRGTGLTFFRMSGGGIVIEPLASRAKPASTLPRHAAAVESPPGPAHGGSSDIAPAQLGRVTIEASKDRQALRHQVDHFVTSMIVQPTNDAPIRWNEPVCPLVAGLPKAVGELILERISKAALDAHAPLAGKACRANLYVVASDHPDLLIEQWWTNDRWLFDLDDTHTPGIEPVRSFIHSRRPVRVWYNTGLSCSGEGVPPPEGVSAAAGGGFDPPPGVPPVAAGGYGPTAGTVSEAAPPVCSGVDTHLIRTSTWSNITSAIVVVDLRRMKHVGIRQLADYIALTGLAGVRLDADPGAAPSILELFDGATVPHGLTLWDRALLYSLYNTSHWDKLQVSEMKSAMVKRIAP